MNRFGKRIEWQIVQHYSISQPKSYIVAVKRPQPPDVHFGEAVALYTGLVRRCLVQTSLHVHDRYGALL